VQSAEWKVESRLVVRNPYSPLSTIHSFIKRRPNMKANEHLYKMGPKTLAFREIRNEE